MDAATEGRLLRLAIAKQLFTWEDLDRAAEAVPEGEETGVRPWLQLVLDAGLLTPAQVESLQAELTPDSPPGGGAGFSPEHRFLAGWPRYRVERLLGSGGMGTVFLAFDPSLDRRVALKLLHRNAPEQTARFLREARAQARVEHPNICQVHEVGEVEGRPYIAMQHIEGKSLAELRGELTPEATVRLVREVAQAIHAAHKTGLIHRDLKPANILVAGGDDGDLQPYVVDFGLARDQGDTAVSASGVISGTPSYLSPEQAQGTLLDRRSDVYSLGVILYEMLAGEPPFQGGNPVHVVVRVLQEDAVPLRKVVPSIPRDLETIVTKCLEKDPARRYDSARALADDLGRWLEGEPIAARPAGWLYRAGKRLRKHRLLATVSAVSCLALLFAGALVVWTRWEARERAALAQRFGQRVEEMLSHMRYAAFLPRHDMRPAKEELRRELDEIHREMLQLGPLAEGPGHSALGQGFLALGRYEVAQGHLERAWKAGEQQPEEAAALARTLEALREKALLEASRNRAPEAREALEEELDATFRQPALAYLRQALRHEAHPEPYLEALLAFYEKRYDDAVAQARESLRQTPWFYEAGQLEAEVWKERAEKADLQGDGEQSLAFWNRAGEVHRRLLAAVPSDLALNAGACLRQVRQLSLIRGTHGDTGPAEEDTLRACNRALEIDPERSDLLFSKATAWWVRGDRESRRGVDPLPSLETSIRLSRRALALDGTQAGAWKTLAIAWRLRGQWEVGRGVDPAPALQRSLEASRRAVELQPDVADHHAELGLAYSVLANDHGRRGLDPRPTLQKAVASYRRALEINPRRLPARINLGTTWNWIAEARIARGEDPSEALARATEAFDLAARQRPNLVSIHNNLGNTWLTLAEYQIARGVDAGPALDRATASYRRTLELQPDYTYGAYNLAVTAKDRALALFLAGRDPAPALAAAQAHVDAALQVNPTDADNFLERGRLEVLAARQALRRRKNAAADLDRADAALDRAEALNPGAPEIFQAQAESALYRAEHALATRSRPEPAIRRGLDRLARALAIRPEDARAFALQGALWELTARATTAPAERAAARARAVELLTAALRANPLLQREVDPVLQRAGGLNSPG
ncbi:MAG TPA: hypothetical protein DD490_23790 [Acidobacteria bacterium]|nr:hypothetical protein [Acidobacteriota bacterium]